MLEEVDIINRYLTKQLTDIYVSNGCFYMPVRITGLGKTMRFDEESTLESINEAFTGHRFTSFEEAKQYLKQNPVINIHNFVRYKVLDRKEEDFANDSMLDNYKGLPILRDHPKDEEGNATLLTFNTIKDNPIIGHIIKAYRYEDQVWGIAKIFDLTMIDDLQKFKSTSPAVGSYDIIDSGEAIEKPFTLNHLAFVENGHWDCKGSKAMEAKSILIDEKDKHMEEAKNSEDISLSTPNVSDNTDSMMPQVGTKTDESEEAKTDKSEEEVKTDESEEVKADESDSNDKEDKVNKLDEDKVEEIKSDEVEKTDEDVVEDKVDEELEEVVSDEIVDEDKERDEVVDSMRNLVDSVDSSVSVRLPYIKGRAKPSEVIRQFLLKNSKYVDSKYAGLVESTEASKGTAGSNNLKLYKEAFVDTINHIYKIDRLNKVEEKPSKGWTLTDKHNVMIDRNF